MHLKQLYQNTFLEFLLCHVFVSLILYFRNVTLVTHIVYGYVTLSCLQKKSLHQQSFFRCINYSNIPFILLTLITIIITK